MGWNYSSHYQNFKRLHYCTLGMDKSFRPPVYWACNYLHMLRFKSPVSQWAIHIRKQYKLSRYNGFYTGLSDGKSAFVILQAITKISDNQHPWFLHVSTGFNKLKDLIQITDGENPTSLNLNRWWSCQWLGTKLWYLPSKHTKEYHSVHLSQRLLINVNGFY